MTVLRKMCPHQTLLTSLGKTEQMSITRNNLHLLPSMQQPGAAQANFAANLLQIGPTSPPKIMEPPSVSSFHAMMITEVTNEDDLPGLDNTSKDLEHIGHMVGVLQARAKEIRDDKKRANPGKENPPKPTHLPEDCTDYIWQIQPALPVLKVVISSKAPPVKPLPPVLPPSVPSIVPQFRYSMLVESSVDTALVISWVLLEKAFLSVEELLALLLEVRKYFKEATTTRQFPVPPTAEAYKFQPFPCRWTQNCWNWNPCYPSELSMWSSMVQLQSQEYIIAAVKWSSSAEMYGSGSEPP